MRKISITILGIMLLTWLLALGCATPDQAPAYRPYETRSWWGSDPTCSPGCPPGQGGSW